jgi:hypothetical protein
MGAPPRHYGRRADAAASDTTLVPA